MSVLDFFGLPSLDELNEQFDVQMIVIYTFSICLALMVIVLFQLQWMNDSSSSTTNVNVDDISTGLKLEEKQSKNDNSDGTEVTNQDQRVLNPAVFKEFKILKIIKVSYNTRLFRFEIPHGKSLGLPIGRHVSIKTEIDGKSVIRPYTPTSRPDQTGYFDLVIKHYDMGKLSPWLHSLHVGSSVSIRGPVGRFHYKKNTHSHIGLIAAGSGLTPCLQFIRSLLQSPEMSEDQTHLTLLYQNRTEEDILLRDDLDELVAKHKSRLSVIYFLSNAQTPEFGAAANGHKKHHTVEKRGYIDAHAVKAYLAPNKTPFVCMCGPSGFNNSVKKLLVEAGHDDSAEAIYVW